MHYVYRRKELNENCKLKLKFLKPSHTYITTNFGFSDADTANKVCVKAVFKIKQYLCLYS